MLRIQRIAGTFLVGLVLATTFFSSRLASGLPAQQDADGTGKDSDASSSDPSEVRFSAEVLRGQIYEHDVGHNLVFRLTPAVSDEGGGWVIGMWPTREPADEVVEFVEIATPPYHGYNERYLAATAGYSAREAVQASTRKFYFVHSVAEQHVASEVVNAALYPSAVSEDEKSRIDQEAANLRLGTGQLHIVHSRITSGKGGEPDTIASVKFEVVLHFSSAVTLQAVLGPKTPSGR